MGLFPDRAPSGVPGTTEVMSAAVDSIIGWKRRRPTRTECADSKARALCFGVSTSSARMWTVSLTASRGSRNSGSTIRTR